jgi:hypothetical protein
METAVFPFPEFHSLRIWFRLSASVSHGHQTFLKIGYSITADTATLQNSSIVQFVVEHTTQQEERTITKLS